MFFFSPIFFLCIDYSLHDPFRFVFGRGHITTLSFSYPIFPLYLPSLNCLSSLPRGDHILSLLTMSSHRMAICFLFSTSTSCTASLRQLVALTKTFHTTTVFLTLTWGHVRLPGLYTCLCATSYSLTCIRASLGLSVTQSVHSSYLFNLHYY